MRLLPIIMTLVFFLNAIIYYLASVSDSPRPPTVRHRRDECTYCWPSYMPKSEQDSIKADNYKRFQTLWDKIPYKD